MVNLRSKRRLIVSAFAAALSAFGGCDTEPVVHVGNAKEPAMNAGRSGDSAGGGGSDDDDEAGEHDDFIEHECTEIEPVCGADGTTYQNACQATRAGVRVAKRGPC